MLVILIVNWNVRELLRACLQSLERFPCSLHEQRIVVVDNASNDGSAEMIRAEFRDAHLVENKSNRGFTGGNNDGLKIVKTFWQTRVAARRGQNDMTAQESDYVLLLNPDTEVTANALDELVGYADVNRDVAVVGPQLCYPDGSVQSSRRRFPTLDLAKVESTWRQASAPKEWLDRYYARDIGDDETAEVDWVVGAAMLVRREAVEQVGGLDEQNFFMYSEELDWCKRIKDTERDGNLGGGHWRVVYHPRAKIVHHEAKSSEQVSAQRMIYFNTSKVRYFAKHHGKAEAESLRASLLSQFRQQLRTERAKFWLGHKRVLRAKRIRAYEEVIRSGLQ
jgi:GT2 family glycosyltransferase